MVGSQNSEIIRLADESYAKRKEGESVRASVAILTNCLTPNYEINWRLSRAFFFLGQDETDTISSLFEHARGIAFGEKAVTAEPDRVEGHFWLGVNLALKARWERRLPAVMDALRAQRELQRAIRIDSAYHAAGPLRVLGRLRHQLPSWLGGGVARSRACYERAVRVAPENTVTRIYYAELLIELGEHEHARKQLECVLDVPDNGEWSFEIERDKRLAGKLLTKLWQSRIAVKRS